MSNHSNISKIFLRKPVKLKAVKSKKFRGGIKYKPLYLGLNHFFYLYFIIFIFFKWGQSSVSYIKACWWGLVNHLNYFEISGI